MHKDKNSIVQVSVFVIVLLLVQLISFGSIITQEDTGSYPYDPKEANLSNNNFMVSVDNTADRDLSGAKFPDLDSGYFTENLGQWEEHILFLARTSFGHVAFCNDGLFYYILQGNTCHTVKITFQDTGEARLLGQMDYGFNSNFFYGNDPEKWVSEAKSYKRVLYEGVWPGIDILYYFSNGHLKYDIVVGEHADPEAASFQIDGAQEFLLEGNTLEIFVTKNISISDSELVAFHEDGTSVPIQFLKMGHNIYGFDVDKQEGKILTIDPVVFSTSTFLGGSGWEDATDVAIDAENNIIVLGETSSSDFPNTTGAYQTNGGDIVVTKMNQNTTGLIFSTYIGNWYGDIPNGLEVDDYGDIYVSGLTWSQYFPTTPGVFQESDPSGAYPDVFVLKLNSQGSDLLYSTYVGGTQSDYAYDIKVRDGKAYVIGSTLSYDFPSVGPPIMDPHGTVLFFILNQDGSNLINSAFFGGWSNEFGYSLAIDKNGDVVFGGVTYSSDFPVTPGAYQTTVNDMNNGFVIKYRPSSNSTIFCTYIGGDVSENVKSLCLDEDSNIYFAGWTGNPSGGGKPYPTTGGAFDRTINGSRDLFITKMDPNGTKLIYSTFVGGDGDEECGKIDVDAEGKVYFTGSIDSELNFTVTSDSFDNTYNGEKDAFILILNNYGSNLIYSSYLGGNLSDSGSGCVLSKAKDIVIFGSTSSEDFPVTKGSFQTQNKGTGDMFITKFKIGNFTFLHEGWNLISIPLIQPDTKLSSVLSSISGYYDAVQWYDADDASDPWKHYHISKPSRLNDLKNLDHTRGFWIHVTQPGGVSFEYYGSPVLIEEKVLLYPGWNLVGYPSFSSYDRMRGLNNLTFGTHVDAIWTYSSITGKWNEMGPSDHFAPGRGYWIHSNVMTTWVVPL